jgi:Icc-related predicted phosphoesterase
MKVLALSDEVVPFIYSPGVRERFADVRLIVGCGDLPSEYLEYVVTQLNVPLAYVPGNHDVDDFVVQGGQSVDGRWVKLNGIAVAGLGGSQRYKPIGRHQYTDQEMLARAARLLLTSRIGGRRVDLFISHAPPFGVHDGPDAVHAGFQAFNTFLRAGRPRLMLHGHTHVQRNLVATVTRLHHTQVINVFPYRVIDLEDPR